MASFANGNMVEINGEEIYIPPPPKLVRQDCKQMLVGDDDDDENTHVFERAFCGHKMTHLFKTLPDNKAMKNPDDLVPDLNHHSAYWDELFKVDPDGEKRQDQEAIDAGANEYIRKYNPYDIDEDAMRALLSGFYTVDETNPPANVNYSNGKVFVKMHGECNLIEFEMDSLSEQSCYAADRSTVIAKAMETVKCWTRRDTRGDLEKREELLANGEGNIPLPFSETMSDTHARSDGKITHSYYWEAKQKPNDGMGKKERKLAEQYWGAVEKYLGRMYDKSVYGGRRTVECCGSKYQNAPGFVDDVVLVDHELDCNLKWIISRRLGDDLLNDWQRDMFEIVRKIEAIDRKYCSELNKKYMWKSLKWLRKTQWVVKMLHKLHWLFSTFAIEGLVFEDPLTGKLFKLREEDFRYSDTFSTACALWRSPVVQELGQLGVKLFKRRILLPDCCVEEQHANGMEKFFGSIELPWMHFKMIPGLDQFEINLKVKAAKQVWEPLNSKVSEYKRQKRLERIQNKRKAKKSK